MSKSWKIWRVHWFILKSVSNPETLGLVEGGKSMN